MRVIVIGLDGGEWSVINSLIKMGKLPTFQMLKEKGSYGYLKTSLPILTLPAWKCYSTGKNPAKLKVFGFINVDVKNKKIYFVTNNSIKNNEIWDYLGYHGLKCGIICMPGTHPARKVNGFMISSYIYDAPNAVYPKELESELSKFKFTPPYAYFNVDADKAIKLSKVSVNKTFDMAIYLWEKYRPHFLHITIKDLDNIQHFFWKYMEMKDPDYGNAIYDIYKIIDRRIKELIEKIDQDTRLILMSDHGFRRLDFKFHLACWLIKRNYLILKRRGSLFLNVFSNIGVERFRALYNNFSSILKKISMKAMNRGKHAKNYADFLRKVVDWEKSIVIPGMGGTLYINKPLIRADKFKFALKKEIEEIKNPYNNAPFVKGVCLREEIYRGEFEKVSPDMVIVPNTGIGISSVITNKYEWEKTSYGGWTGDHRLKGIYLMYGKDIKGGVDLGVLSIYDIAPTILHMFDVPIPIDMDGRVLKEVSK